MTLDLSKPVQTRDGRPVRILCTNLRSATFPVVGIASHADGSESAYTWTAEGFFLGVNKNSEADLINTPPKMVKVQAEVRLFRGSNGNVWSESRVHPEIIPNWSNDYVARQVIEMEYEEPQS